MMDKKPKKELIDGIKDFLKDFEEPYDHKEWKNFERQRKSKQRKPIPLFIKLAGIAASLFLMVYASVKVLPLLDSTLESTTDVSKQAHYPTKETEQQAEDTLTIDSIRPLTSQIDQTHEHVQKGLTPVSSLPDLKQAEQNPIEESPIFITIAPVNDVPLSSDTIRIEQPTKKVTLQTVPLIRDLNGHRKPLHSKPNKSMGMNFPNLRPLVDNRVKLRGINVGANINPAFTNKGFSVGGGASAQIPLSSRIATEIGANYSSMTVGTDLGIDEPIMEADYIVETRNTVGVVAIPISLNYSVTEHFAASLGLMPFKVVRDQRTDIIQSYRRVTDGTSSDRRLVSERNESKRPDSLYMGNTYLGFIQVSGYLSPPFLKKHHAVIAPFVGIPAGRLRDDEYQWLHGGVSFRIYLR